MTAIKNGDNLRAAIDELKTARHQQKNSLGQRFSNRRSLLRTLGSLVPRSITNRPLGLRQWLRPAVRFAVPMLLIQTIFNRKSFLFKALMAAVAKKAATYIH